MTGAKWTIGKRAQGCLRCGQGKARSWIPLYALGMDFGFCPSAAWSQLTFLKDHSSSSEYGSH